MRSFQETTTYSELTCEQRHALRTDGFLLINAVAGSGKTRQLVALVLKALMEDHGAHLGQFAIITFTRKAGAQLRARLKQAMEREKSESSTTEEQRFWDRHLTDLPGAAVGTIDSLVQDLLRRAAMTRIINLDPDLGVLDELGTSELLEKAVSRVADQALSENGQPQIQQAMDLLQRHHDRTSLLNQVCLFFTQGDGQKAHEAIQYVTQSEAKMREVFGHLANPWKDSWNTIGPTVAVRLEAILRSLPTKKSKTIDTFRSFAVAWQWDPAHPGTCFESLRETLFDSKNKKRSFSRLGQETVDLVDDLQDDLAPLAKMFHRAGSNVDLAEGKEKAIYQAWGTLFLEVDRVFEGLCREENRFPFSLLMRLLERQLRDMNPAALKSLGLPFRRILVDEFQDNTTSQWKLVCRLAGADQDNASTWKAITVVGDPEQAIYHWRGSNAQLIRLVREQYQNSKPKSGPTWYDGILEQAPTIPQGQRKSNDLEKIGLCTLSQNWRTVPETLSWIETVSSQAMQEMNLPHTKLVAGTRSNGEETSGRTLFIHPDATNSKPADDEREPEQGEAGDGGDASEANDASESDGQDGFDPRSLKILANHLAHLNRQENIPWRDMLILAHSFKPLLDPLQDELDARGIPYRSLVRSAVWRTQHVRDVVRLTQCLGVPDDGLALLAVLRGPCCRLSDSEIFLIDLLGKPFGLLEGMNRIAREYIDPSIDQQLHQHLGADRANVVRAICKKLRMGGTWRQPVDRMPHHELIREILVDSEAFWTWNRWLESNSASLPRRERLFQEIDFALNRMETVEGDRPVTMARMAHLLSDYVDGSIGENVETELSDGENLVRLMTIHSSKGLQAKVVAILIPQLAGRKGHKGRSNPRMIHLDQQYFAPETPKQLIQATLGLPLFTLENLDRTDANDEDKSSLFSLARLHHQRLQEQETALLFHVAMTRAESHLLIAGVSGLVPDDLRHWPQKWIEQAHQGATPQQAILTVPEAIPPNDCIQASTAKTILPHTCERMSFPDRSRISLPATALQDILLEADDEKKLTLLRLARQSLRPFLGGIAVNRDDRKKPTKEGLTSGKILGTLVHRACQMGPAFPRDEKAGLRMLQAMAIGQVGKSYREEEDADTDPESSSTSARELARSAWDILTPIMGGTYPRMRQLFEAKGQSEVDFALPFGHWVVRGRIDRILDGDNALIDWKTDHGDVKDLVEAYRPQMTIYALAWWKHHQGQPKSVQVRLALLRLGQVEDLSYPAEELREWEQKLAHLLERAVETPRSRPTPRLMAGIR